MMRSLQRREIRILKVVNNFKMNIKVVDFINMYTFLCNDALYIIQVCKFNDRPA
jgi:hypothetical protein